MPDVHVDSVICFSIFFFFSVPLWIALLVIFCSHFTFDTLFKVNCIFWLFNLFFFCFHFFCELKLDWNQQQPAKVFYLRKKSRLFVFQWKWICFVLIMTRAGVIWIVLVVSVYWMDFVLWCKAPDFSVCFYFLLDSGSPALFSAASCSMKLNFRNKLNNKNFTKIREKQETPHLDL